MSQSSSIIDEPPANSNDQQIGQKRLHLKNLLERIVTIEEGEDLGVQSVKQVSIILEELNLFENNNPVNNEVGDASETILDAKVINSASNVVLKCVNTVSSDTIEYDPNEFTERLISFMNPNDPSNIREEDFLKLHDCSKRIIREIPPFAPIFGGYKCDLAVRPPKEKTKRVNQQRNKVTETKLVKVVERDEETEVLDHRLNFMFEVLKKEYERNGCKPIGYYKFVIDTGDFGCSVQNVFYTSFLVREGKAKIDVEESGRIVLSPVDPKETSNFKKRHNENTQLITSFSMSIWKKFVGAEGFLQHYKNLQR